MKEISLIFACAVICFSDFGAVGFHQPLSPRTSSCASKKTVSLYKYHSPPRDSSTSLANNGLGNEIEVKSSTTADARWFPSEDELKLPVPLNNLIDVNLSRRSVVYEVTLGRELGLDISQGNGVAIVGQVFPGGKAEHLGIVPGDIIVSTSATAGDQMWSHDTAEGVTSALRTRFVMSPTVKMRLERPLEVIPESFQKSIRVPYIQDVKIRRPIGLHVVEGPGQSVYVQFVKPDFGAAKSKRVEVGDQIVAMSASWGDRMWDLNSVESFVVGVKMRTDAQLTFRVKRMVPLEEFTNQMAGKQQRLFVTTKQEAGVGGGGGASSSSSSTTTAPAASGSSSLASSSAAIGAAAATTNSAQQKAAQPQTQSQSSSTNHGDHDDDGEALLPWDGIDGLGTVNSDNNLNNLNRPSALPATSAPVSASDNIFSAIENARSESELKNIFTLLQTGKVPGHVLNPVLINKIMSSALALELPDLAIDIFEDSFGFYYEGNPAKSILKLFDEGKEDDSSVRQQGWTPAIISSNSNSKGGRSKFLEPNNFVCTTAVKAYGRKMQPERAMAILPWMENYGIKADNYLLSALVYVCAKAKRVPEAEKLFWRDMPARNLSYTVATTNSLMYMYAKLGRADDALKVYELTKGLGLKCTVVTYGVLIKALMRSGKKKLQDTSFEILRSLPTLGIFPGIEIYNQFLEHFSRTHDYRQTRHVLRLMSEATPRVKPDSVSYGYLVSCFADARKPRSALAVFQQMRKRQIAPNAYTYMGVLKALAHMRDGLSAAQVIAEMREQGANPDKKHFSMAMFACVTSNQCSLAESIFSTYMRTGEKPDTALYSLFLRALLQQSKWQEGMALFKRMLTTKDLQSRPNFQTLNTMLQYQITDERYGEALKTVDLLMLLQQKQDDDDDKEEEADAAAGDTTKGGRTYVQNQGSVGGSEEGEPWSIARKFFSRHPRGFVIPTMHGTYTALAVGLGSYSSQVERMQRDDHRVSPTRTASEGATTLFTPELEKPSEQALEFLVSACEIIGKCEGAPMQAEFYLELLKACILEGQPVLGKRMLRLREAGQIRLKDSSCANVKAIEDLARRALGSSGSSSAAGSSGSPVLVGGAGRSGTKLSVSEILPKKSASSESSSNNSDGSSGGSFSTGGRRPSVTPKIAPDEDEERKSFKKET